MNVGSLFSVSGVLIPVANVRGHLPHTIKQFNADIIYLEMASDSTS